MNNFVKFIFGIPPEDQERPRTNDNGQNDLRNDVWTSGDNIDEDDVSGFHSGGISSFGFPVFSFPMDIHKDFDRMLDEMQQKFEMFGFKNFHSNSFWEEQNRHCFSSSQGEETERNSDNLRDLYLKSPNYNRVENIKKDINLDGQMKVDDVENVLNSTPGPSNESNSIVQYSPKVFSKSVMIRTIRRPDGSVETVKKIRDHTGHEETIITQENVADPGENHQNVASTPGDDIPGMFIFRKFFRF